MPLVLCVDPVPAVGLLAVQQHLQRGIQAAGDNPGGTLQTFYSSIPCYRVGGRSSYPNSSTSLSGV